MSNIILTPSTVETEINTALVMSTSDNVIDKEVILTSIDLSNTSSNLLVVPSTQTFFAPKTTIDNPNEYGLIRYADVNTEVDEHNNDDISHPDIRLIAETAESNSETAVATANEAKETADNAESVANGIDSKASEALSNSETAVSTANEAKAIALSVEQAKVFDTFEDMETWLKDEANKGLHTTGLELLIKDNDVPDYWVTAVLETPNANGYYYDIEENEASVLSVNGKKGVVVLKTDDISDEEQTNKFVTSEEKTAIASSVPNSRKVNNKALSEDIVLKTDDISDTEQTNKWSTADEKEKVSKIIINGDGTKALLNDGTYGEVGTVDTVNNVLPDENKNITITADDISDEETTNKFVTEEELAQIATNTENIEDLELYKLDNYYYQQLNNPANTVVDILLAPYTSGTFELYLENGSGKNTEILWGDGNSQYITSWGTVQHTYWTGSSNINYESKRIVIIGGDLSNTPQLYINGAGIGNDDAERYIGIRYSNFLTSVIEKAFDGCSNLIYCELPDSITSIYDYAFRGCSKLKNIILPKNITVLGLGYGVFQECTSLEKIEIPGGIERLKYNEFAGCSNLRQVILNDGLLSLNSYDVFDNCINLKEIKLPSTITNIGQYAFNGCSNLSKLTCLATIPPALNSTAFTGSGITAITGSIYVPYSSLTAYKTATNWSTYADRIFAIPDGELVQEIIDDVTAIQENYVTTDTDQDITGEKTFKEDVNIGEVESPKNLNIVGDLNIAGDIIQEGSTYETHAEQIYTTKDEIILREGAVAGLATGALAKITAKLYDGTNDGVLGFDKDGIARVGDVGSEQAIATREDTPTDEGVARWDEDTFKFVTETPDTTPTASSTKLVTSGGIKTYTINGDTTYGGTISSNFDVITKDGFYTGYGTATGAPNTTYSWFILHENSNTGTVSAKQTATAYYATEPLVYVRVKTSSIWGSWIKMPNANDLAEKSSYEPFTATLSSSSWTGTSAPYSKEVTVSGILATDKPDIDLDLSSSTYSNVETIQTDWSKIYRAVSGAGTITFYASEVPTIDIPLQIKVVR